MVERDSAPEERPTRRPPSAAADRPAIERATGVPVVGEPSGDSFAAASTQHARAPVASSERTTAGGMRPPAPKRAPAEGPPPIFSVGELVDGTYEVRKVLGEGGMAQVFEAHDHLLDRRVALKAAWPDPHLPPLRNEARALAAFRHPSLVTVHTLGHHRGIDFIVMERVYGITLSDHISERKRAAVPFRVEEVVAPIAKLAAGLAIVHRAGIAHRDVKPGNVMLTPTNRVVLMDFGLVLPEYAVSSQNFIAGSPPYMPPEALTNTVGVGSGQLVDIYALGVMAWEMLALRRPYDADDLRELVRQQANEPAPRIDELRDDVPPRLAKLIAELMCPDAAARPQSAEAVGWQLQSIAERVSDDARRRSSRAPASVAAEERPASAESSRRDSVPAKSGAPPSVPASKDPTPSRRTERLSVLIVDDDEAISRVLGFYVQQALPAGVELRFARDGDEAVALLRDTKDKPDLILLDLHMPKMNGIEVMMHVRGENLAPRARVVGVSAGAQEHDLQLLHQLGLHHFVPKGESLKERLNTVIENLFGKAA